MHVKSRRGSVAVLVAVMMTGLVAVSAVSIDVTRLASLRNELQFSADAGAHAGAIQLVPPNDPAFTADTAAAYSLRYLAMQGVVHIDSVELGGWDDTAHQFTPGALPTNAVRVVVSRQASGLLISHFGVNSPLVRARAVGWIQGGMTTPILRVILAQ